ncbi:MAG: PEP/pyruvate-binding domain-containing protein, partial [Planctomycetota bacterium]
SFAGQYDTFLNVKSLNECIESVKKCWASLWTERAFDYRCQNGIDHIDVQMAVIVQKMVDADVSGIIFTADPLTGNEDKIVIEAARGLGEHIVQGKVPPDRCVVEKSSLKINEYKPAGPNAAPCMDRTTVKRLARLALKVESYFSVPQDIEWSIKDRNIWLLQTRPITALPRVAEKLPEDKGMWSHFPAQEVMPDVITPATKSLLGGFTEPLLQPLFDMLCIDRCGHPIMDYIAGRAYFNGSLILAAINALPGSGAIDLTESAGSDPDLKRIVEFAEKTPPQDLPQIKFHKLRFFLKLPLLAGRVLLAGQRKGQAFMAQAIA